MFSSTTNTNIKANNIFNYLKGLIVASLLSLGLIILFAFCLKWFSLSDSVIMPVNLVIKGLSVLIGALIAVKGDSRGLIKGFAFGIIYILFAFLLFSLLAGTFSVGLPFGLDLLFGGLIGGVVGIIKVNKK